MTDHDALVRAICHAPDDDTPRLVYADYLEDTSEAARAEFVRAQVELARTPDWEPFAVLCRTRKMEWSEAGEPFRDSLPPLGPELKWHPQAFCRGLGWRVKVGNLRTWCEIAPRLYDSAPVGELDLKAPATRDEWQAFAAGDWVKHFRVIHLEGTSPVEAIRALCENPAASGITDIHFHRASSPGLPELVEDLLASPLGRGLKGLHFAVGYQNINPLIDVLENSKLRLQRLTLQNMQMNAAGVERLLHTTLASELTELSLSEDRMTSGEDDPQGGPEWMSQLPSTIHTLRIVNAYLDNIELEAFADEPFLPELRVLDLSRNYSLVLADDFFDYRSLRTLRALSLRGCFQEWRRLVQSRVWENAVYLDLRGNPIGETAALRLIESPPAPHLTALLIDEPPDAEALRERFGEALIIEPSLSR